MVFAANDDSVGGSYSGFSGPIVVRGIVRLSTKAQISGGHLLDNLFRARLVWPMGFGHFIAFSFPSEPASRRCGRARGPFGATDCSADEWNQRGVGRCLPYKRLRCVSEPFFTGRAHERMVDRNRTHVQMSNIDIFVRVHRSRQGNRSFRTIFVTEHRAVDLERVDDALA